MKRLIAILFIVFLLIGVSVTEELLLHHTIDNVNSSSSEILSLIDESEDTINTEEISSSLENLKTFWNDEEKNLCFFTSYEKIKNMDESIAKLYYAIKNNDRSLAIENVACIQNYSNFLHYIMGFNLNNLF